MSVLADRFPALARHWQVLRESWREQNFADKAFQPREEHEFLPAALEIMEKPPSPGLRWLMLLTCGLFVLTSDLPISASGAMRMAMARWTRAR